MKEKQISKYFDLGLIGMAVVTPEKDIIEANDFLCDMVGFTKDELLRIKWSDISHPDDLQINESKLNQVLSGEMDGYSLEKRLIRKDGSTIFVNISSKCTRKEDGSIEHIISLVQDITERKKAEKIIRKSELKYRTVVENAREYIWQIDMQGNFVFINRYAEEMSGQKSTNLKGMTFSPAIHPDDLERVQTVFLDTLTGNVNEYETRIVDDKGIEDVLLVQTIPLYEDEEITGTLSFGRNITERRKMEEALRESEEKYRTLVEQSHDGIYIYRENRFLFVNDRVCELTGYSKEELYDLDVWELIHPDDRAEIEKYKINISNGIGIPNIYQIRVISKDGQIRFIEVSVRIITYQGESTILGVGRDISDQLKLDEERQKNQRLESLGIFAGGLAHDFNNFLTGILGNISLAKTMTEPGSDIYRILSNSENASNKASSLTHQLLTFAKGGVPVRENLSINELLRQSADFVLSGSNVNASYDIPCDLWTVNADKGQISQVIQNIIINADQSMLDGGVVEINARNTEIDCDTSMQLNPGKYVKIEICDSGTGISEDHISNIFDPFYSTKKKGSGLGLTTAFSIIKKHDGNIIAKSRYGIGTAIIIHLPASTDKVIGNIDKKDYSETHEGRILIMDDKDIVRTTISSMLEHLGYDIESARNGDEAIEKYRRARQNGEPFKLVILDLTVPGGKGGRETIEELRKIDPDIKAIVSSGYSTDPVMAHYKEYGFMGVIMKPYTLRKIESSIREILES
ncbi:MAG: PAS domain S-box protein [Candidatus Aegiribacteria sp.]|nr:PAS domain S-box protein [Candidatus Aegiribacteria sp.]